MIRFAPVILSGVLFVLGCGGGDVAENDGPPPQLTVEAWRELPIEEKYDEATFDRLKDADPQLKSPVRGHLFIFCLTNYIKFTNKVPTTHF